MLLRALGEIVLRALWLPLLVLVLHLLGVFVLGVYHMVDHLDIATHIVGGAAIAWFFRRSLGILRGHRLIGTADARTDAVILFGLVCAAAIAWELAEFVLDRVADTAWQQTIEDTLKDELFGVLGGVAYLLASRRRAP